jgi:hypothetical protein
MRSVSVLLTPRAARQTPGVLQPTNAQKLGTSPGTRLSPRCPLVLAPLAPHANRPCPRLLAARDPLLAAGTPATPRSQTLDHLAAQRICASQRAFGLLVQPGAPLACSSSLAFWSQGLGDLYPEVVIVPPVALTVPPPRSVAMAAELALLVEMLTLVSCNAHGRWSSHHGRADRSP